MLIDLKDKVAIVTGAGRGIGREIARVLASEGVRVVAFDIRQDFLDDVGAEWRREGWTGLQVNGDVRLAADGRRAVAEAVRQFGRLDILVNNAGVAGGAKIESLAEEVWDANLDANLKGTFLMCQAAIPQMKAQGAGRIINAASFAAIIPSIGSAAYASSKAGVEMFTRVLAGELGPFGITANSYAPGMIPTEMNHYADATDERKGQLLDTLTLRRWGSPTDIANLVCFLASDQAGYITGTMIDVSGGKFATQMPWMAHRAAVSDAEPYREAIAAVRPDLADLPLVLHTRGWDSDAVEVSGTIFKFPKRPEAVDRLRREVRFLALVRPRVRLAVPDMILHETPTVFSEHPMIPGTVIETNGYNALDEAPRQAMAEALGRFYADLHTIPIADAIAAGAEPKPEWPTAETVLPLLADRLPAAMQDYARRAFAAYAALPPEDVIFGYFDGHGWNMAFDHARGVLNGVYDFADAGVGPRSREFTYSNLISGDLTERLVEAYTRITGHQVDLRTVAIRTAVQTLSELAEADTELDLFLSGATRWHDYMQSRPDLRL